MKKYFLIIGGWLFLGCGQTKNEQAGVSQHIKAEQLQAQPDDYYEKCRKLTLSEKQIGQEYFFSIRSAEIDEISITYLGDIITTRNDSLRILNSVNYSGKLEGARRGTGRVFIYDVNDRLIGFYPVGGALDIPLKVENGALIFKYSNSFCNESTTISLKDSIPKTIFVNCTKDRGNIYNFQTQYP